MDGFQPSRIPAAIPIATTLKHTPQQIAFNEVGRQAVMADSNWRNGDYYGHGIPAKGLAIARMIGHITYMSDASMAEKLVENSNPRRLRSSSARISRLKVTCVPEATTSLNASMQTATSI